MGTVALLAGHLQGISNKRDLVLYTPNYILPPGLLNDPNLTSKAGSFIISIDPSNANELSELYHSIDKIDPKHPFCLFLMGEDLETQKSIQAIVSFFFFPDYRKIHGAPLLLLEEKEGKSRLPGIITKYIIDQGFPAPLILMAGGGNGITILSPAEPGRIEAAYRLSLSDVPDVLSELYVSVSRIADMDVTAQCLDAVEDEFKRDHKELFHLQQEYRALKERSEASESLLRAASQEIATLSAHMGILRSDSPATGLQNYYDNEYEILPTWYKKFGHILKVMKGKRTLRSLFSDKEKKYKD